MVWHATQSENMCAILIVHVFKKDNVISVKISSCLSVSKRFITRNKSIYIRNISNSISLFTDRYIQNISLMLGLLGEIELKPSYSIPNANH
jgi:hypothetical protein